MLLTLKGTVPFSLQVVSLEERLVGKTDIEREKDSEAMKSRKLLRLVEKYKAELETANFEIRELKSRLLESSDYKVILIMFNISPSLDLSVAYVINFKLLNMCPFTGVFSPP